MLKTDATAAFYAPWLRFWELMAGSLLAALTHNPAGIWERAGTLAGRGIRRLLFSSPVAASDLQICRSFLSVLGLGLIVLAVLRIHTGLSFPGKWALCPVAGAFLLIAAGPDAVVNRRLLSLKFMVWLGLISYPLYLWHWPLLSFSRIIHGETPPLSVRTAMVVTAVALAWITYRFIEPPLRWGRHGRLKTAGLFLTMLALGSVGICMWQRIITSEFLLPQTEESLEYQRRHQALNQIMADSLKIGNKIFPDWGEADPHNDPRATKEIQDVTVALIGDSHAGHLFPGLAELYSKSSQEGIAVFAFQCAAPFLDLQCGLKSHFDIRKFGYIRHKEAYHLIERSPKLKTLILAHNPGCSMNDIHDVRNPKEKNPTVIMRNGMRRTFDYLKAANKNVIVLLDNPYLPFPPEVCAARPYEKLTGEYMPPAKCSLSRNTRENFKQRQWYNAIVREVAQDYANIKVLDLFDVFCDAEKCLANKDGYLLYRDRGHLTYDGSRMVAPVLQKLIESFDKQDPPADDKQPIPALTPAATP